MEKNNNVDGKIKKKNKKKNLFKVVDNLRKYWEFSNDEEVLNNGVGIHLKDHQVNIYSQMIEREKELVSIKLNDQAEFFLTENLCQLNLPTGFGKTYLALNRVKDHIENNLKNHLLVPPDSIDSRNKKPEKTDKILFFVPNVLFSQWSSKILEVFGEKFFRANVLALYNNLKMFEIEQILEKRIILMRFSQYKFFQEFEKKNIKFDLVFIDEPHMFDLLLKVHWISENFMPCHFNFIWFLSATFDIGLSVRTESMKANSRFSFINNHLLFKKSIISNENFSIPPYTEFIVKYRRSIYNNLIKELNVESLLYFSSVICPKSTFLELKSQLKIKLEIMKAKNKNNDENIQKLQKQIEEINLKEKEESCMLCYSLEEDDRYISGCCKHAICKSCLNTYNNHKELIHLKPTERLELHYCPLCRASNKLFFSNFSVSERKLETPSSFYKLYTQTLKNLYQKYNKILLVYYDKENLAKQLDPDDDEEIYTSMIFLNNNGKVYDKDKTLSIFRNNQNYKFLVINSKNASSGLNLEFADAIVLLNNFSELESQIIGRAHRYPRTTSLHIYRFIAF